MLHSHLQTDSALKRIRWIEDLDSCSVTGEQKYDYFSWQAATTALTVRAAQYAKQDYERTIEQEQAYAAAQARGMRCFVFTHQAAALSCVKWRHDGHLNLWPQIQNPTPSVHAYLPEEYFCQISSRSNLKRRSLRLSAWRRSLHQKKNKNKMSSDMRSVPTLKILADCWHKSGENVSMSLNP